MRHMGEMGLERNKKKCRLIEEVRWGEEPREEKEQDGKSALEAEGEEGAYEPCEVRDDAHPHGELLERGREVVEEECEAAHHVEHRAAEVDLEEGMAPELRLVNVSQAEIRAKQLEHPPPKVSVAVVAEEDEAELDEALPPERERETHRVGDIVP